MHRMHTQRDPLRVTEMRGLRYVDVRCAKCRRRFRVPRLPGDTSDAQAEGLHCERCSKKRDAPVSLALTKKDLKSNPPLPFTD
jgi:hypothetical protein